MITRSTKERIDTYREKQLEVRPVVEARQIKKLLPQYKIVQKDGKYECWLGETLLRNTTEAGVYHDLAVLKGYHVR